VRICVECSFGFVVNRAACSKECYTVASGDLCIWRFQQLFADSENADISMWEDEVVYFESELGRQFEQTSSGLASRVRRGHGG